MKLVVGLATFVSCLAASQPAHAYLDPGSVSLALQAIVATIAGAALTWKHWYWRVRGFLGMDRKRESDADDSHESPRSPGDAESPPRE